MRGKREARTLRAEHSTRHLTAGQTNPLSLPVPLTLSSSLSRCPPFQQPSFLPAIPPSPPSISVALYHPAQPFRQLFGHLPYPRFLSSIHRTAFFPLGLSPYLSAKSNSRIPALWACLCLVWKSYCPSDGSFIGPFTHIEPRIFGGVGPRANRTYHPPRASASFLRPSRQPCRSSLAPPSFEILRRIHATVAGLVYIGLRAADSSLRVPDLPLVPIQTPSAPRPDASPPTSPRLFFLTFLDAWIGFSYRDTLRYLLSSYRTRLSAPTSLLPKERSIISREIFGKDGSFTSSSPSRGNSAWVVGQVVFNVLLKVPWSSILAVALERAHSW